MTATRLALVFAVAATLGSPAAAGSFNHSIDKCVVDATHKPVPNAPYIQFRLQADGHVTDLQLDVSSGDAEFDTRLLACARDLLIEGKPPGDLWVASLWQSGLYVMEPPPPGKPFPPLPVGRHTCGFILPKVEHAEPRQVKLVLAFRITVEGDVSDPKLVESSGSQETDEAVMACVSKWHYRPAYLEGKPVEVPSGFQYVWNLP
jgi:TonB family protein